jgi:hypothetical protein
LLTVALVPTVKFPLPSAVMPALSFAVAVKSCEAVPDRALARIAPLAGRGVVGVDHDEGGLEADPGDRMRHAGAGVEDVCISSTSWFQAM